MKRLSLKYFAGFIDGEGTITIDKIVKKNKTNDYKSFKLSMGVTNTYLPIIDALHKQYGGYLIKLQTSPKNCKPYKKVIWEGLHAVELVKKLKPHLIIKQKQANLLIAYWKFRQVPHNNKRTLKYYTQELKFINKMRKLNRRGTYEVCRVS